MEVFVLFFHKFAPADDYSKRVFKLYIKEKMYISGIIIHA